MNKKETLIDQFKTYVGAYYGVNSMDEYDLKAVSYTHLTLPTIA